MPRNSPLEMSPQQFRELGHQLVDQIAEFLGGLAQRPVTPGEPPSIIRNLIGTGSLPQNGTEPGQLLRETADMLFDHSLFNGHPRFWGYITSTAAPIGALAEMLAATINPNVGGWNLSPVASEIERQTIRWIAELIGYDPNSGGVLVSGGNMANMTCFLAARAARVDWDLSREGMAATDGKRLTVYASAETHTWISKVTDMSGMGTACIRWIPTDSSNQIDLRELRAKIKMDMEAGFKPFMLIGTAGSVSTGVVDPLDELAAVSTDYNLWYHVDGAYGALAACVSGVADQFKGMQHADSLAVDPHKWLYAPLEVGCALVKNEEALVKAFSFRPAYYKFDKVAGEETSSFVDFSLQNSRGFRSLKVWLALKQVGRSGYEQMIGDDIRLAKKMATAIEGCHELELFTQSLSIVTFRYVPSGLNLTGENREDYLNELNTRLLTCLQEGGELFVSNAVIRGTYMLRACIVNFRTNEEDVVALPGIVTRLGREVDSVLRKASP